MCASAGYLVCIDLTLNMTKSWAWAVPFCIKTGGLSWAINDVYWLRFVKGGVLSLFKCGRPRARSADAWNKEGIQRRDFWRGRLLPSVPRQRWKVWSIRRLSPWTNSIEQKCTACCIQGEEGMCTSSLWMCQNVPACVRIYTTSTLCPFYVAYHMWPDLRKHSVSDFFRKLSLMHGW